MVEKAASDILRLLVRVVLYHLSQREQSPEIIALIHHSR